ncbi:hypothetical protein K402DRAFT_377156 [Aulographum hederae CBS 113979]|uniref:ASST-domain-containing protein n=1 Tax=Aulographum hederae CBS 113979 TaxID=1176131 RepID=A0A6G1H0N3_9PEZI|nr:hypothetical protein K402DRAFT_377156 [Aulographum hederae CBS 113979]
MRPYTVFTEMLCLFSLLCLLPTAIADLGPFYMDPWYQRDRYGEYPHQFYNTDGGLMAPRPNIITPPKAGAVSPERYIFLNPRGTLVRDPVDKGLSPIILDARDLSLVWMGPWWGAAYPFMMQEFKGKKYLTFWAGDQMDNGYGRGNYYMLDETYNIAYNLTNVGLSVRGDFHEFQLTRNGTFLCTSYEPITADFSGEHPDRKENWILDSIFQEIDVETNDLIFEWRASSIFKLADSFVYPGEEGQTDGSNPDQAFDFYHINSVTKDDLGNYLVSGRHTHSLSYIDHNTGKVLWNIGGKRNTFKDVTKGAAKNFAWQHHARWVPGRPGVLTLFDNGATDTETTEPRSRGMRIKVDPIGGTVALEKEFLSQWDITSSSQGSLQTLSNGNSLVGYGSNPVWTEFSESGEILWDVQFGMIGPKELKTANVMSYRVYKFDWVGRPTTRPTIVRAADNMVWMSWNGATEIAQWIMLTSEDTKILRNWTQVTANVTRQGFETSWILPPDSNIRYIRAIPVDASYNILGASSTIDMETAKHYKIKGDVSISKYVPQKQKGKGNNPGEQVDDDDGEAAQKSPDGGAIEWPMDGANSDGTLSDENDDGGLSDSSSDFPNDGPAPDPDAQDPEHDYEEDHSNEPPPSPPPPALMEGPLEPASATSRLSWGIAGAMSLGLPWVVVGSAVVVMAHL